MPIKRDLQYVKIAPLVALPAPSSKLYTYAIDRVLKFKLHSLVRMPFGRRAVYGVIMEHLPQAPPFPTKKVTEILSIQFKDQQIQLGKRLSSLVHGSLGYTLRLFLPPSRTGADDRSDSVIGTRLPALRSTAISKNIYSLLSKGSAALIEKKLSVRIKTVCHLSAQYLKKGQQILVIVPEKWLAQRWWQQCQAILPNHTHLVHSTTLPNEQRRVWHRLAQGVPTLIIGTQKSLFLPYEKLGLVVVEEENFSTHKLWDQYPRLDNILGAELLANIHQCPMLWLTSHPSLKLWHDISTQKISSVGPLNQKPPAKLTFFHPLDFKQKRFLPHHLIFKISQDLKKSREVLIFSHRDQAGVRQKVKTVLKTNTPGLTIAGPGIFTSAQTKLFSRVVWIYPESFLSYPDYRSLERAASLLFRLSQLSRKGEVEIISRRPRHLEEYLLVENEVLYQRELALRQKYHYPPFTELALLTFQGSSSSAAHQVAHQARQTIEQNGLNAGCIIRGPFQSLDKKQTHSWHLLLRGPLSVFPSIYQDLNVDRVDINPHRIL